MLATGERQSSPTDNNPIAIALGSIRLTLSHLPASIVIEVGDETREDFTVTEEKSGQQYRFVLPGAPLSEAEWTRCLGALKSFVQHARFVIASGSLPPNVPDDFYARAGRIAKQSGCKMALDTAGAPLAAALKEGCYLLKPSLRELQELAHVPLLDPGALARGQSQFGEDRLR